MVGLRGKVAGVAVTGALALAVPASASAAEVIGQAAPSPPFGCATDSTWVQGSLAAGRKYTPSSYGVITSWSAFARETPGERMKLLVLELAGGTRFKAVAKDTVRTLATPGALNTFSGVRLPIEPSQTMGIYQPVEEGGVGPCAWNTSLGADEVLFADGEIPENTPVDFPTTAFPFRLNAEAVVEPDTDRDVFGDESQDKCLGTAGPASGCPSTVTLDRLKQKGTKPKLKVSVTVPGAGTLQVGSASDPALASSAAKRTVKSTSLDLTTTTRQQVTLTLKLTKTARARLADRGKLKVRVKAVYTPSGGAPGSATAKKKLKR
jgi:hypothetical protein